MGIEYERKYLVATDAWRDEVVRSAPITQGYICATDTAAVRVRLAGAAATITVKGATADTLARIEVECSISAADGLQLLDNLCVGVVDKVRHTLSRSPEAWTVDVFGGANAGLVLLEIEATAAFTMASLPDWVGVEVTSDRRYQNSYLSEHPFSTWQHQEDRGCSHNDR